MRQTTAYYLMLLYLTVMLKPLMPLVADSAAHFFNEAWHEATVHARYGTHHTDREIANTGSENDPVKNGGSLKSEDPVPTHVLSKEYNADFKIKKRIVPYVLFKTSGLPLTLLSIQVPPPKFS